MLGGPAVNGDECGLPAEFRHWSRDLVDKVGNSQNDPLAGHMLSASSAGGGSCPWMKANIGHVYVIYRNVPQWVYQGERVCRHYKSDPGRNVNRPKQTCTYNTGSLDARMWIDSQTSRLGRRGGSMRPPSNPVPPMGGGFKPGMDKEGGDGRNDDFFGVGGGVGAVFAAPSSKPMGSGSIARQQQQAFGGGAARPSRGPRKP